MNDEQIRKGMAEACGWQVHPKDRFVVIPPNSPHSVQPLNTIPDYLNDLNACAEFEKTLPDDVRMSYGKQLQRVLLASAEENAWLISATARQRCEAFLRTKGLWDG